jgi:uncharacterized protein YbcC (UPF0753/DUF2309 family)
MPSESTTQPCHTLSSEGRERLRHQITEASGPIAPFWPMRSFAKRNPLHGLEHLPFDRAVREAKHLLGGNGYLSNSEYRQLYRQGRITDENVKQAFQRIEPSIHTHTLVQVGPRRIGPAEVLRLQLLFGFEALEPVLLTWTLGDEGATRRFQNDLPAESRQRILARAAADSGLGRSDAEESYVTSLWNRTLSALQISDRFGADSHDQQPEESEPQFATIHAASDVALPAQRTVGDWLDSLAGASIVEQINDQMTKWIAAFVDEGMAGWSMPGREGGFYPCWRELAQGDISGRFLGIKSFAQRVRDLPSSPEDAIALGLNRLGVPQERRAEYLSRHLAQLPGWAGFIRWLGENPDYPGQRGHPIDPLQYLAVRLFYEVELADALCRREWGIAGTLAAIGSYWQKHLSEYRRLTGAGPHPVDAQTKAICDGAWRLFRLAQFLELAPIEVRQLPASTIETLLGWLDAFPEDQHGPVWLEAYEANYREKLIARLSAHRGKQVRTESRPRAQLVCCIDVRSEPFRRHVEAQGPYETFGFAGFFGVFVSHQAFDSEERNPLCPVLFKPKYAANETPRPGQDQPLRSYASGTRWRRLGDQMFHDLKQNPIGSFMLIDLLGFFFSIGLIGKTLMRRPYKTLKEWIQQWFNHPVATQISVDRDHLDQDGATLRSQGTEGRPHGLPWGLTLVEQANSVEFALRMMGLTKNFGRFVVLCGHGSATENNPYFAALDCGACGGKHGDPNARVFANMANKPEVRRLLKERGLAVPDDTWFLAGKHITTSDRVAFYDVDDMPATHREDFSVMVKDFERAGANHALERCGRLPRSPRDLSPETAYGHVVDRTTDWANVRPEWGLSSSAAFIIGRRNLTRGIDLAGRVFLQSYDPEPDTDGKRLEFLMTAPLIVVKWLNTEYYFSAVDPWFWGSGSKVIHNVVSGVGVMLGSQSDLQTGLPLQSVNDGQKRFHEPMRPLTIIEAPVSRISPIIHKHTVLQHLFHNQWVTLVAVDPTTGEVQLYNADATWQPVPVTSSFVGNVDRQPELLTAAKLSAWSDRPTACGATP